MIKKYPLVAAAIVCSLPSCAVLSRGSASLPSPCSAADSVSAVWTADTLRLRFAVTEPSDMGSGYAVWNLPRLGAADGDTLTLKPAVFRGKRNMQYVTRERHFSGKNSDRMARRLSSSPRSTLQLSDNERLLGDTVVYDLAVTRAERPWLWEKPSVLIVKREKDGCCSVDSLPPLRLAALRYVPPFVPKLAVVEDNAGRAGELRKDNPVLHPFSEYQPYTKDRILRKDRDALYVHFELDKAVLKHSFRSNAMILDRIVDITRQIMADSTSMVKKIQIVGLASVEGRVAHNEWLAGARADALKRYVQERVSVPDSLFDVANGGEAWTELRSQIEDSQFDGRDALLHIIDTEADVNVRERLIKSHNGGKTYSYLRDKVLADQRNSGYLRIYYDYVPDHAAAVINKATALIGEQRYAEALEMLRTVSSDRRAQNALGVALYMTGSKEEAISCIRRAAEDGNREAQDNLRQWEAIEKALRQ